MFTVNVPVTNLRSEPIELDFLAYIDRKQESQLIFGETVQRLEVRGGWVKVNAIEQDRFRQESNWTGYPGWVKEEHLTLGEAKPSLVVTALWTKLNDFEIPLGAYLEKTGEASEHWIVKKPDGTAAHVSKKDVQIIPSKASPDCRAIVKTAELLIGHRYSWGGRCPHRPDWQQVYTSVDCSGLVNLAYRVHGLSLPRDAHDQFLISDSIQPQILKTADLIFLAPKDRPHRMNHVMLYLDGDRFIDANDSNGKVVISTGKERFGVPFSQMSNQMRVRDYIIHFGRPLCLKA